MEKERILHLVNKSISCSSTKEEMFELQNLLQKNMGVSDTHKVLLHLYNIQSLVSASEKVQLQKQPQATTPACQSKATTIFKKKNRDNYLSPRFFLHNNLFRIYCALTLRQLNRVLY